VIVVFGLIFIYWSPFINNIDGVDKRPNDRLSTLCGLERT